MALSSSSTLSEIEAQYMDNLDWDGDAAKAKKCLAAIRALMIKRPQRLGQSGRQVDYTELAAEKKLLEAFVASADSTVRSRKSSFTRARMQY